MFVSNFLSLVPARDIDGDMSACFDFGYFWVNSGYTWCYMVQKVCVNDWPECKLDV